MNASYTCYLSLGANLGHRGETMREALRRIARLLHVTLQNVSRFYETPPWGKKEQPPFLNAVAKVRVTSLLSPLDFLRECQRIETELGRVRHEHWGARAIDIDLLHIPSVRMGTLGDALVLPHPYLLCRAFALVPLAEIEPRITIEGKTAAMWCGELPPEERAAILPAEEISWPFPLKLIACIDEGRGLGRNGQLLAQIPEDMVQFRAKTMGHAVIMGRRTMESLPGGKPLAGRDNIVLSRSMDKEEAASRGFRVCHSLGELWQLLGRMHSSRAQCQFWCIGGSEIYRLLLPYVMEAHLTVMNGTHDADCFFPSLDDFSLSEQIFSHALRYEIHRRIL